MFPSRRRLAVLTAATFISVLALSACGGGESDTDRTRNAAMPAATCADGGECVVGDIGPGGGIVFYDAGQNEEWGRYLEVVAPGWAGEAGPIDPKARLCVDVESCPKFKVQKRTIGLGKSTWSEVSDRECTDCAQNLLKKLNEGDIKDWFVPNIRELRALLKSGITRPFVAAESYFSISNSREITTSYLVWRSEWNGTASIRTGGKNMRRIVPIRQFAAMQQAVADTNQAEPEQSNVLETVTNLRVRFENGSMIFDFDKQSKGLAPEGHFITMDWEVLKGSNSIMLNGDSTSGSTDIFPFMRGTKLTAYVSSYTNATSPPSTADTDKIDITIPMTDDTPASTPVVETPTNENVSQQIGNVNEPILNVPSGGAEGEINPASVIDNLATEIPQVEVEKLEILVKAPSSPTNEDWQPVSTESPTPYSIPADATSVTLRITSTDGQVIEQEKLVVHVAAAGEVSPPAEVSLPAAAPAVTASSTTVPTSETTVKKPTTTKPTTTKPATPTTVDTDDAVTESTVVTEDDSTDTSVPEPTTDTTPVVTSDSSGDSSGPSPVVWLLIAIIALLLAGLAAQRMKKAKS